jgi:hypothetical protein
MDTFSFTRFCLRVLADLNEIIRRMKRKVILTIAIKRGFNAEIGPKDYFEIAFNSITSWRQVIAAFC